MNKRGEIEVQFNWIYIAIVGGLVLVAAFSIIPKLLKSSEQSTASDFTAQLESMITAIKYNSNSENELNLLSTEFIFNCADFSLTHPTIGALSTENQPIFSPNIIKSRIYGYSLIWEMPFKTEYFTFLSSPGVKYVFKNSLKSKKLYDFLPNNLNKNIFSEFSQIKSEDYYKIRLITFDSIPSTNLKFSKDIKDEDVTIIKIEIIKDQELFPDSFGKAIYYEKDSNSFKKIKEVYFFDKASLIAAIYADSPEYYLCNLKKAINKLHAVSMIKKNRIGYFVPMENLSRCPFEESIEYLEKMESLADNFQETEVYFRNIYDTKIKIREENLLLDRLSCPTIY